MRYALKQVHQFLRMWASSFSFLEFGISFVSLILVLCLALQAQDRPGQEDTGAIVPRVASDKRPWKQQFPAHAEAPDARLLPNAQDKARVSSVLSALPVSFEPNRGQADPSVEFLSRGPGYSLFLTQTGAFISIQRPLEPSAHQSAASSFSLLHLEFIGGNSQNHLEGDAPRNNRSNYFLGDRADHQLTGIPNFARVRYPLIYPGTDLVFHGDPSRLEFDLNLAPGADPTRIRFRLEGADQLSVDASGDLIAKIASTEFRLHRPVAFQPEGGNPRAVRAQFVVSANREVSFRVGDYDRTHSLTIDPVLSYASFLGGSGAETAYAVALDPQHNFYVSGETASSNFPVAGSVQGTIGGTNDAFVLKIKSDGSGLAYSTFLGGSLVDASQALAVDSTGSAYVTGFTSSSNFPTVNALQPTLAGGQDIFVAKLSPDGASLVFSTYLGGTGLDTIAAIALDPSNNVVLAGTTKSLDFPVVNALQPTLAGTAGNSDAFVAKLKADGSGLIFSTYFGGTSVDGASGVAVSSTGNIWVSGGTGSTDLPVVNALQPTFGGGGVTDISPGDAFLAEFKPDGSALLFSTYWGGSGQEQATSLSLDSSDNVFLVGMTSSTDFPTHSALQPQQASRGGFNTFITKFAADGSSAPFSTYFGGSGNDLAFGSAMDASGNIFISGSTSSPNLPVLNAIQSTNVGGLTDGFVSELSSDGSALLFSTYLGGTGTDSFNRIAVDSSGVYVVGSTDSSDFPTSGNLINTFGGGTDGVIVRLAGFTPAPDLALSKTHAGTFTAGSDGTYTLNVSNVGNGPTAAAITVTDTLPTGLTYSSASGANWTCAAAAQVITCTNPGPLAANASSAITLTVHIASNLTSGVTNTATVSVTGDTNSANDSASDIAQIGTAAPIIGIAFGDSTIGTNLTTSLKFYLNNPGGAILNGLAFTNTLPAGLIVATPGGLNSDCGGTATAANGSNSIVLTGGTVLPNQTCVVAVTVTATTTGVFNDSVSVTSTNGGTGNTASASLTVANLTPFTLASSFSPSAMFMSGTSNLLLTFTNPNSSASLNVEAGLAVQVPPGLTFSNPFSTVTSTCQNGGAITASQDGTGITMAPFTLAAGASCTITAPVTGTTAGTFTANNSVTSNAGVSTANATLTVNKPAPFTLVTSFIPSTILMSGTSTLSLTYTNPNPSISLSVNGGFIVQVPPGLTFVSPFTTVTSTCKNGGAATFAQDGTNFTMGAFTLASGASCTVTAPVTGTTAGTFTASNSVDAIYGGTSNTATGTLTVNKPAAFTLVTSFNPPTILTGSTSTLSLTYTNPNPSISLSVNAGLTARVPSGLTFLSAFTTVTSTCKNGGAVTFAQDGTSFTMGAFTLASGASCTVTAPVTGTTGGTFTASNSVDAIYGGTSNTATATLVISSQAIPLTITANNVTRFYGGTNPTLSATASGFVNGDTMSTLTGTLICSSATSPTAPVGNYAISCSGLSSTKYAITFVPGVLTVTPAPLTIAANNQAKAFNQPNPTLTWVASGFVNGENTNVLTTLPTCTTTATTTSPAGTYPITCSGAAAANYSITYVPGTLTVTGACHYLSMALSPSTIPQGGTARMNGAIMSCSSTRQVVSIDFKLTGPLQPRSCGNAESVILQTPPFALPPNTSQNFSFPVLIPRGACPGSFTVSASTVINKTVVDTTSAVLTVTPR